MSKQKVSKGAKAAAAATAEVTATQPQAEPMSKADAVRKALAAGKELPTEGVAYVKAEFGVEVSPAMFSAYKAAEKKKADRGAAPKATTDGPRVGNGEAVEFVRQVKGLVEQYGAQAVRDMVKVFDQ